MRAHLQMRANSEEGIWMVALYSVSGMPSLCGQAPTRSGPSWVQLSRGGHILA